MLIPKKSDALEVGDYRLISLPHSFSKLFAKLLANRIRPCMKDLVATNQSAFIRDRNMHDNYLLVKQVASKIPARKNRCVFLKLDISRAFDSLSCPFLFEVLCAKGFRGRCLRWLVVLL